MHFLYLDEAGGTERPDLGRAATPVMAIVGVIVHARLVPPLTRDFLAIKRRFFPSRFDRGPALDHVLTEVKGGELLRLTRSSSRNQRRQAALVRAGLLNLVRRYGCRVIGRVWVKRPGQRLKPAATYCYAVQDIAVHFDHFLAAETSHGVMIADSRSQNLNIAAASGRSGA
ncbi:MAG: hypothetical protein GEV12_06110 [Micromonosporaceae bacterium]|nr:hypothetical protein [Micromonosporaceae bacterium]